MTEHRQNINCAIFDESWLRKLPKIEQEQLALVLGLTDLLSGEDDEAYIHVVSFIAKEAKKRL